MSSRLSTDELMIAPLAIRIGSPVRADGDWRATWREWGDVTGYGFNTSPAYMERRRAYHTGLDLVRYDGATAGAHVYAAADGVVCRAAKQRGWSEGDVIVIRHDGCYTRYAHVVAIVKEGDEVRAGDLIAYIAHQQFPHLHFDVASSLVDLCATPNHWAGMSIKLLLSAYYDPHEYALKREDNDGLPS